jgi:mannan endo-1,4-beta-mannosidase
LDTESSNDSNAILEIGRTPKLIDAFYGFEASNGGPEAFPAAWVNGIISMGSTPMITWQPDLSTYKSESVLTSISDGSQDSYIRSWAEAAKSEDHPILVRLMHEFNGDWYPWGDVVAGQTSYPDGSGTYQYSNTPQMFVSAFQHVVSLFQSVGADNVQFVWCFSASPLLSDLSSYYPGDQYVAWPSMDGYNRSATSPRSFYEIFGSGYQLITSLTTHPILIAETASVEFLDASDGPSSKAQWILDAYLETIPEKFPQIRAVDWFDSPGKGYSYQINSAPATQAAIREVFSDPLYQGSVNNIG